MAGVGCKIRLCWTVSATVTAPLVDRPRVDSPLRFAFMSGTSLLIVGFSFVTRNGCEWVSLFGIRSLNRSVQYPGIAPTTLCLIISGVLLLALGAVYEVRTSREPLFPPQLFKDISCGTMTFFVSPDSIFTNHGYSRNPYRSVSAQFLLYYRNVLYHHLFSGEILTNSEP